jgi:hypothetical protein
MYGYAQSHIVSLRVDVLQHITLDILFFLASLVEIYMTTYIFFSCIRLCEGGELLDRILSRYNIFLGENS